MTDLISRRRFSGLLAAASVAPFAAAASPGPQILFGVPICHSESGATSDGSTPATPPHHDCALCPLCQAVTHAGQVVGPALVFLPPPALIVARAVALPPARAPPPRWTLSASYPRGPPLPL